MLGKKTVTCTDTPGFIVNRLLVNPDQVSTGAAVQAPAGLAEVGAEMNDDGPALILGVNSPILGWVLHSVFGLVWALHATSIKDMGVLLNVDGASSICGCFIKVDDPCLPATFSTCQPATVGASVTYVAHLFPFSVNL